MASFEQDTEMVETKHADASVSPQRSSGNDRDLSNKNKGPDIVSQDVDQELRKLRFQNYVPRSDVLKTCTFIELLILERVSRIASA